MEKALKIVGVAIVFIIILFSPETWFNFVFWLFRKIGLFVRYAIYFSIGKKKELKQLDRIQRDANWFSQRGINTCLGAVIAAVIVCGLIYY